MEGAADSMPSAGYDEPDMVYVGRPHLECNSCDSLASSLNPFYRKPIKSKLKHKKFRPWKSYKSGAPSGCTCSLCVYTARKRHKAQGGVKYLQQVTKDKEKKVSFKASVDRFIEKTLAGEVDVSDDELSATVQA